MSLETRVMFILTGLDVAPDDITDSIGIQPTQTWRRGDFLQKTCLGTKHDGWCLASRYTNDPDLSNQIVHLIDALEPFHERILRARRKYNLEAEISCVVYLEGETPIAHFDSNLIGRISRLQVSFDLDIILLGDD